MQTNCADEVGPMMLDIVHRYGMETVHFASLMQLMCAAVKGTPEPVRTALAHMAGREMDHRGIHRDDVAACVRELVRVRQTLDYLESLQA